MAAVEHPSPSVGMRITARADYAVRAAAVLAAARPGRPVKADFIARSQGIPQRFLHGILTALTHAGVLVSTRGADGGYELARPAAEITVADVVRAVEGPFAAGGDPAGGEGSDPVDGLQAVWAAVRANERAVLEAVTLADLAARRLPAAVRALAWEDGLER